MASKGRGIRKQYLTVLEICFNLLRIVIVKQSYTVQVYSACLFHYSVCVCVCVCVCVRVCVLVYRVFVYM